MPVERLCNASPARTSHRFPHSYFLIFTSYFLLFHRRHLPMPNVPGLRSCYDKVGRLIYFGRMLDKIRLHAAGKLPAEYHDYLGERDRPTLDGRCCCSLGVSHSVITSHLLARETHESVSNWARTHGTPSTADVCNVSNC